MPRVFAIVLDSLGVGGIIISIGPPLAAYPLAGSLLDAGAWPPAIAAFILSWISVGIITLPFEAQDIMAREEMIGTKYPQNIKPLL